jgi:hypothetical protein
VGDITVPNDPLRQSASLPIPEARILHQACDTSMTLNRTWQAGTNLL